MIIEFIIFLKALRNNAKDYRFNVIWNELDQRITIENAENERLLYVDIGKNERDRVNCAFIKNSILSKTTDQDQSGLRQMVIGFMSKSVDDISHFLPRFYEKDSVALRGVVENLFVHDGQETINKLLSSMNSKPDKFSINHKSQDRKYTDLSFSCSVLDSNDNPLSLISNLKCEDDGDWDRYKSYIEEPIVRAVYPSIDIDKNISSHRNMNEDTKGMFDRNIPEHLQKFISYENYKELVSEESLSNLQNNKLAFCRDKNIEDYNRMIYLICNDNEKIFNEIKTVMKEKNINLRIDKNIQKFSPELNFNDIYALYDSGFEYGSVNHLMNDINYSRVLDESCHLREMSEVPFLYSKEDTSVSQNKDSLFVTHAKFRDELELKLAETNENLNLIKDKYSKLRKFYDDNRKHGRDYRGDYEYRLQPLKRDLAEEISKLAIFMDDNSNRIFCGIAVSDVFSSVMSQYVELRDVEGRLIDLNTSRLGDEDRNRVLNETNDNKRRMKYADLIYKIEDDNDYNGPEWS